MASNFRRRIPFRDRRGAACRQSGAVLIMATLAIFVLLGFAGLAIDVGYLEHVKRRMQTAADAGALAGDWNLYSQGGGLCAGNGATSYTAIQNAALADVQTNRFPTDGSSNVTVTVNCGSNISAGYYVGDATAVEVVITQTNQPMFFMAALGGAPGTVSARAVAHLITSNLCMLALDPTASDSLWLQGNATLNTHCDLFANSNANQAIKDNSGSFSTDADFIGAVGGAPKSSVGNSDGGADVPVRTGMLPYPDPFASLPAPISSPVTTGRCDYTGNWTGGDLATQMFGQGKKAAPHPPQQPGTYVICGSLTGGGLPQGYTYVVTGNLSGNSPITMDGGSGGVMFYLTCMNGCAGKAYGDIDMHGGGGITASAPTSGTYQDILIYGDRHATKNSSTNINGDTSFTLSGALYLPHTAVGINGNSGWTVSNLAVVADQLSFSGHFTITANSHGFPNGWPIQLATMGE